MWRNVLAQGIVRVYKCATAVQHQVLQVYMSTGLTKGRASQVYMPCASIRCISLLVRVSPASPASSPGTVYMSSGVISCTQRQVYMTPCRVHS